MKLIRCSYPNCVLEEHLEGEHKLGRPDKPWGTLRQVQEFAASVSALHCDMDPGGGQNKVEDRYGAHTLAVAFYADMLGFGWALCAECARKFSTAEGTENYGEKQKVAAHRAAASAARKGQAEKPASGPQSQQATPKRPEDSGQALTPSSAPYASSAVEAVAAGPAKVLKFARRNA